MTVSQSFHGFTIKGHPQAVAGQKMARVGEKLRTSRNLLTVIVIPEQKKMLEELEGHPEIAERLIPDWPVSKLTPV
jgi:hypothetical protein